MDGRILFGVTAVMALAACTKTESIPVQKGEECEITVSVDAPLHTKITGAVDTFDAKVKNIQVVVYNDGQMDGYVKVNASTATLKCTSGSRKIYVVANGPDMSGAFAESTLKATVVNLNEEALANFTMVGDTTVNLPGTKSINVAIHRLVSRIAIKKVVKEFGDGVGDQTFKIDSIYVVNAAGNCKLVDSFAPTLWYNDGHYVTSGLNFLSDTPGATIAEGDTYSTSHYYYAFPNPGTSKKTLLVLSTTFGSQRRFYPLELPALESNKSYEFTKITLKRPGSVDPTTPVTTDDISFSVTVTPWVEGLSIEEEI